MGWLMMTRVRLFVSPTPFFVCHYEYDTAVLLMFVCVLTCTRSKFLENSYVSSRFTSHPFRGDLLVTTTNKQRPYL